MDQPTITDGTVTLRPWRDDDVEAAIAGHDDEIAHWFGFSQVTPTEQQQRDAIAGWRRGWGEEPRQVGFVIEAAGGVVGCCDLRDKGETGGEMSWALFQGHRGQGYAARAIRVLADFALTGHDEGGLGLTRVEARVEPGNQASLRVATRAGLRREGLRRVAPGTGDRAETSEYVVLARLSTDPPLSDPQSFRSLLNSFLPRKRAIGQMLLRDEQGRVLLCQLTYKKDWDLPGGVVEVGESPRLAVAREVKEELGLDIEAGALLLTDWLPPWGGWDDAVCLVFDGGVHDPEVLEQVVKQEREIRGAQFCDLEQVRELCADFTARRIEAALGSRGGAYTESGVLG